MSNKYDIREKDLEYLKENGIVDIDEFLRFMARIERVHFYSIDELIAKYKETVEINGGVYNV